jgi:hypothetical protein
MADTTTTNYGLTKPEVGASEDTWGTKLNDNLDTIDGQLKANADAASAAQSSANTALAKDPTLTLSGDASGSATFTNLGNATLSVTVANDSHTHDGRYRTESELSSTTTSSGAKLIGTYDEFANSNSTNVQDVLDDLDAAISGKQPAGTYNTVIGTDTDINTSGATIIDNLYMTDGVITSHGTRTLTLGDLGYTPPVSFPSGTAMLFQQTSAPTGWTKQTTHNNKALRVVSGTASSGGTTAFTTAFGTPSVSGSVGISGAPAAGTLAVSISGSISGTTLSTTTMPSHTHGLPDYNGFLAGNNAGLTAAPYGLGDALSNNTNSAGSNGSHSHSHTLSGSLTGAPSAGTLAGSLSSATAAINVQYVDLIIATKD